MSWSITRIVQLIPSVQVHNPTVVSQSDRQMNILKVSIKNDRMW